MPLTLAAQRCFRILPPILEVYCDSTADFPGPAALRSSPPCVRLIVATIATPRPVSAARPRFERGSPMLPSRIAEGFAWATQSRGAVKRRRILQAASALGLSLAGTLLGEARPNHPSNKGAGSSVNSQMHGYVKARDGTQLFCRSWGRGRPVVFVH